MGRVLWQPVTAVPSGSPPDLGAATHRSRRALETVLAYPDAPGGWRELAGTYDEMAAEWSEWAESEPDYVAPVEAGLRHVGRHDWAVEIGCGTGQASSPLARALPRLLALDVNWSMVRRAAPLPNTTRIVADVRCLPFADASVPLMIGLNAVPHIAEFARVLRADGQILWCTSFGAGTPLYLSPERLCDLLGPGWHAVAGRAGHGDWTVLSRRSTV